MNSFVSAICQKNNDGVPLASSTIGYVPDYTKRPIVTSEVTIQAIVQFHRKEYSGLGPTIQAPVVLNGLPAQEGIGLAVNDIPGVGGIGHAGSNPTYVPRHP